MPEENGRNTRFKKGNPGGPGRPPGSYKDLLTAGRDIHGQACIDKLFALARKGSITALKLVLERTEGLPVQSVEHSGTITVTVTHV